MLNILIFTLTLLFFSSSIKFGNESSVTLLYSRPLIYAIINRKKWLVRFTVHYNDLGDVDGFTYNSIKI